MPESVSPRIRGAVFSGRHPMQIRLRKKTQTRRLVILPKWSSGDWSDFEIDANGTPLIICENTGCFAEIACPYGKPGDILYVKEPWRTGKALDGMSPAHIGESGMKKIPIRYECGGERRDWGNDYSEDRLGRYRNARFMPRWAARTYVRVVAREVQNLLEITEEDAIAEGVEPWPYDPQQPMTTGELGSASPYRGGFACIWDELHEERTWKSDPAVWKVTMELLGEVETAMFSSVWK